MNDFSRNNFDLIRLVAASEVMLFHMIKMFAEPTAASILIDALFPGVPIFFFISGLLVSESFFRNRNLKSYAMARALRIYPALYFCLAFSIAMISVFYHPNLAANFHTMLAWVAGQLTILQSWNPDLLRGYGTGVVNASLWTIPVEILFYISVPIVFFVSRWLPRKVVCWVLFCLSFLIYTFAKFYLLPTKGPEDTLYKVLSLSPASILSWLWMFLVGMIVQMNKEILIKAVSGKVFPLAVLYIATGAATFYWGGFLSIIAVGPFGALNYLLLCALILSIAFTRPQTADQILKRNDISYGIYLFHWPIGNVLLSLGVSGAWAIAIAGTLTIAAATASWTLIERPAMRLRSRFRAAPAVVAP